MRKLSLPTAMLVIFMLMFTGMVFAGNSSSTKKSKAAIDRLNTDSFALWSATWSSSGGPEASVSFENGIVHKGKHSTGFNIKIDFKRGRNPKYPVGWLFCTSKFPKVQDWSEYKGLEFYIYAKQAGVLKYGIVTNLKQWFAKYTVSGKWIKVTIPFDKVRGNLKKVKGVTLYVPESKYRHGDKLNFYFADFKLVKTVSKAKEELDIEKKYKALSKLGKGMPRAYANIKKPLIYPVTPFEFIYSNSDLSARKTVGEFEIKAAGGEKTQLTFAILAGQDEIKNFKLEVSDLTSKDGSTLAGKTFDVRVVKVWEQAGLDYRVYSKYQDGILVPELLVKDDRIPFNDSRDKVSGRYTPPLVSGADFGTDIPAHSIKQIWINIFIPKNTQSGIYKGRIRLKAENGLSNKDIPVQIKVLPFKLPASSKMYVLYYRPRCFEDGNGKFYKKENLILADLREIKKAGCEGITIYNNTTAAIKKMLNLCKKAGLKGPFIIMTTLLKDKAKTTAELSLCGKNNDIEFYFYGIDEAKSKKQLKRNIALSKLISDNGGRNITTVVPENAKRVIKSGGYLDWANYPVDNGSLKTYIKNRQKGKAKIVPIETYYWQFYQENPTLNRFFAGFYLWQSGMDGVFPYEFQEFKVSPYNSGDVRATTYGGSGKIFYRSFCVVYPGKEGPVSTLEWEGFCAGITDVRYLTYLKNLIAKVKKNNSKTADKIENELKKILAPFSTLPDDPTVKNNPYVDPKSFGKARKKIIKLILKLKKSSRAFK